MDFWAQKMIPASFLPPGRKCLLNKWFLHRISNCVGSKCESEHLYALWALKCKMNTFCILGPEAQKVHLSALWVHLDPLDPLAPPPPGGAPGLWTAGWGWMGRGAETNVGWAASGASAAERRPPLSGSGASARQSRKSFPFTPIPAGGLLVFPGPGGYPLNYFLRSHLAKPHSFTFIGVT